MQACSVANIDTAENCKDNHVIRKFIQHWANGLPDSVQNHISPALKDMVDKTGGSIKDYLTLVHRHIVSEPDRIVVPRYPCGWCSEELRVSCTCSTARRLKMTHENPGTAKQTGANNHQGPSKRAESSQGRLSERNVRVRLSDVEHKDLLKKGLCFVCKDIWTRDHQCKTKGLNAPMIPEVSAKKQREGEHLEALMDWAVMGATVSSNHQSAEAQAA
jgi:hypothetical protein